MRIVCAWCRTELGHKRPLSNRAETSTICTSCRATVLPEIEMGRSSRSGNAWTSGASETSPVPLSTS